MAVEINEGVKLVEEGVCTPEDVDIAMKYGYSRTKGPFEMAKDIPQETLKDRLEKLAHMFNKRIFEPTKTIKEGRLGELLKDAAKEFAEGEFDAEYARKCDIEHVYPREVVRKAAENGFIGMQYPEEYGGGGLEVLEVCLTYEELCKVDSTLGEPITSASFGCEQIWLFGTDEQKENYLPKVCSGDWISCGMYTEPDAGSDVASYKTTAEKDGNQWF